MDPIYRLVVDDDPDPAELAHLEERVATAAMTAAGLDPERDLAVFVRDERGSLLGGISGITWGGYCELHAMWVDESVRGQGLARRLMTAAEDESRRRGCGQVIFMAYDLLTPHLYERLGYEAVAVVDDCPTGSAARWFRKRL